MEKSLIQIDGTYKIINTEIYEDNNWDLSENLEGRDQEFYNYKNKKGPISNRDTEGKIPLNIGCGVKAYDHSFHKMVYTDSVNMGGDKREVVLRITTWMGVSEGAIHYYGRLKFQTPDFHPVGEPTTFTSCFDLKLFNGGEIELTHKLKDWELKKYPKLYKVYKVGNCYPGFYNQEEVIKRGKQVFEDLFEEGWELKIERC